MSIIYCPLRLAASNLAYICNQLRREASALSEMRWPVRSIWKVQQPRDAKVDQQCVPPVPHMRPSTLIGSAFCTHPSCARLCAPTAPSYSRCTSELSARQTCFPAHPTLPFISLASVTSPLRSRLRTSRLRHKFRGPAEVPVTARTSMTRTQSYGSSLAERWGRSTGHHRSASLTVVG